MGATSSDRGGPRRADYERLCAGESATGASGSIAFAVDGLDLDRMGEDLIAAAGLGLALVGLGWGVRLVPREDWHRLTGEVDLLIAAVPGFDPSYAAPTTLVVAWVTGDVDAWLGSRMLPVYDKVLAGSDLVTARLRRAGAQIGGIVRPGVDVALFGSQQAEVHRSSGDLVLQGWSIAGRRTRYFELPEEFASAAQVVDDLDTSRVEHGIVNPAALAAAACGARVVFGSRLAVREMGLATPVQLTEAAAFDPDLIAREHGWDARAQHLLELREEWTLDPQSVGRRRPGVLHFYPDFSGGNPYQDLLYADLEATGAVPLAVGLRDLEAHLRRQVESVRGPGLLHLHWTGPILQQADGPFRAHLVLSRVEVALRRFKEAGGGLIWTVHNVLPHDVRHRWAHVRLSRVLSELADVIHVLCQETLEAAGDVYELDPGKVRVLEHSSYTDCYPDWISRAAARERLGIAPDQTVLVALGVVRPYKGLDALVDLFERRAQHDPLLHLLVAGRPTRDEGIDDLVDRCLANPRVTTRFDFVPDDQIQVWLKAADIGVLPYSGILNSGAFMLMQQFGLPVVAPDDGALAAQRDRPHVRLFGPGDPGSLDAAVGSLLEVIGGGAAADLRRSALAAAAEAPARGMSAGFAAWLEPAGPPGGHPNLRNA